MLYRDEIVHTYDGSLSCTEYMLCCSDIVEDSNIFKNTVIGFIFVAWQFSVHSLFSLMLHAFLDPEIHPPWEELFIPNLHAHTHVYTNASLTHILTHDSLNPHWRYIYSNLLCLDYRCNLYVISFHLQIIVCVKKSN